MPDEPNVRPLFVNGKPQPPASVIAPLRRAPIRWAEKKGREPPKREWAVEGWLGRGHVTLMAGPPGSGKTAIAQSIGAAVSIGRSVIDHVPRAMNVLLWAGEDDENELWRRQAAIAQWLETPIEVFDDRFVIEPYPDEDITLAGLVDGTLVGTPNLKALREQIGDYRAELVFLDSVARLFGGNENDRHQVTKFMALLTGTLSPTNAAMCLLGHPAKATGSEFSGSTAWEASVRARLYFGFKPPGEKVEDELEADDDQRWLAKRKTNYSQKDIREVRFRDGCMQPANAPEHPMPRGGRPNEFLIEEAVRTLRRLSHMGIATSASPGRNFLPSVAAKNRLLEGGITERDLKTGLAEALKAGRVRMGEVGKYGKGATRMGLVEVTA